MREPTTTLPAKPADRWPRRIVGWIYVAIGAAVCAGVVSDIGPFAPPPESEEARRLEWAFITIPFYLFFGSVFAFAGCWTMTHPRVHRPIVVVVGFLVLFVLMVARNEM